MKKKELAIKGRNFMSRYGFQRGVIQGSQQQLLQIGYSQQLPAIVYKFHFSPPFHDAWLQNYNQANVGYTEIHKLMEV